MAKSQQLLVAGVVGIAAGFGLAGPWWLNILFFIVGAVYLAIYDRNLR